MADAELQFDKPIAVLDTNVVLDAISCVHMVKHYDNQAVPDPTTPDSIFRRQKARESLLLSVYLNSINATTYSIFEATRITVREVAPEARGTFENHAMIIWVHYVKDTVLPDWTMVGPSNGDDEPVGNAADALLVEKAKEFDVPLISHEGITVDGINPKSGIRKKAVAAGVKIVTAREFYGEINEDLNSHLFLQGYGRGAEAHIGKSEHPEYMRESMLVLQAYYQHILYGHTEGFEEPLPVRL
jgi:hypothetical protein